VQRLDNRTRRANLGHPARRQRLGRLIGNVDRLEPLASRAPNLKNPAHLADELVVVPGQRRGVARRGGRAKERLDLVPEAHVRPVLEGSPRARLRA
jgi:hypothetical protein